MKGRGVEIITPYLLRRRLNVGVRRRPQKTRSVLWGAPACLAPSRHAAMRRQGDACVAPTKGLCPGSPACRAASVHDVLGEPLAPLRRLLRAQLVIDDDGLSAPLIG